MEHEEKYNKFTDYYTTTNLRVWKMLWNDIDNPGKCGFCMPGQGCNRRHRGHGYQSWKSNRKTQYK